MVVLSCLSNSDPFYYLWRMFAKGMESDSTGICSNWNLNCASLLQVPSLRLSLSTPQTLMNCDDLNSCVTCCFHPWSLEVTWDSSRLSLMKFPCYALLIHHSIPFVSRAISSMSFQTCHFRFSSLNILLIFCSVYHIVLLGHCHLPIHLNACYTGIMSLRSYLL